MELSSQLMLVEKRQDNESTAVRAGNTSGFFYCFALLYNYITFLKTIQLIKANSTFFDTFFLKFFRSFFIYLIV